MRAFKTLITDFPQATIQFVVISTHPLLLWERKGAGAKKKTSKDLCALYAQKYEKGQWINKKLINPTVRVRFGYMLDGRGQSDPLALARTEADLLQMHFHTDLEICVYICPLWSKPEAWVRNSLDSFSTEGFNSLKWVEVIQHVFKASYTTAGPHNRHNNPNISNKLKAGLHTHAVYIQTDLQGHTKCTHTCTHLFSLSLYHKHKHRHIHTHQHKHTHARTHKHMRKCTKYTFHWFSFVTAIPSPPFLLCVAPTPQPPSPPSHLYFPFCLCITYFDVGLGFPHSSLSLPVECLEVMYGLLGCSF